MCALALTGCSRYDDNVLVENGLDERIAVVLREASALDQGMQPDAFERRATDTGDKSEFSPRWPDPDPPWHIWPLSAWGDPPCHDELHIVAYLEDGRTIVREPPLCPADSWTVTD